MIGCDNMDLVTKINDDLKNAITELGQNPSGATKINLGMKEADSLITKDNTLDDVPKTGDISNNYSFLPLLVMLGWLLGLRHKFYRKV